MTRLGEKNVLFGFVPPLLGDVLEKHKNAAAAAVLVNKPARTHQHGLLTELREVVAHLIADDCGALRHDLRQQLAKVGDVPLPVSKIKQPLPQRFVLADLEGLEERLVARQDAEGLIEHQQRRLERIDDALGLNVTGSQ
ncbi:hypothetical protein ASE17_19850 [Phenylobacterium sp. Root77]|nr:hypothetical protein ASC73_17755 [Phenylobacterium sp. Root1277]KQW89672.1 hypothetical protein ASC79_18660 [Phenylobacterium sp. Root1290]KRC43460.1 hypothetical protein ASE17_19850 [Phenylobacterium sp. Root77]